MTTKIAATSTHPELAKIAAGRDHIQTAEFARAANRMANTVRRSVSLTGQYLGITPVKVGRRLLWPVAEVAALLAGGQQ